MASVTINAATQQVKITAVSGAVPVGARIPTGGTSGQTLTKSSGTNYDTEWSTPSGSGDMVAATYDPTAVAGDAFDMANMVEATTEKIFTATERTKLSGIETSATADQTGAEIKAAYEAEANAYTDTLNTKLAGIEASADVTDEANVVASLNGATLTAVTVAGTDKVVIQDASDSDNIKTVTAQSIADLGGGGGSPEGTAVLSTGETGGTKFLREDGDGTSSWQTISGGGDALVANPLSQFAATTSAQLAGVLSDETGSGAAVFGTSPTLVTPALGTPSSGVATNLTGTASGLTAGNVTTNANLTGHITSTGNAAVLGSFTSLQLKTALSDETGSGAAVFATSPTLVTPVLGTPTSGTLTNTTGLPIVGGTTGTLSVARGGTGAVDAGAARTALGVAIGSDVQAYQAAQAQAIWESGTVTTASVVSPAHVKAAIDALASGGGGPALWTTLETATDISGATSYDVDLPTSYNEFWFYFAPMQSPADNVQVHALFSDDDGATVETTGYEGNDTDVAKWFDASTWDTGDEDHLTVFVYRVSSTLLYWRSTYGSSPGTVSSEWHGYFDSGSAADLVRVGPSSGNWGTNSRLTVRAR